MRLLHCWQLPKNQAHESVQACFMDTNAALAPLVKFKLKKNILRSGSNPKEGSWQSAAILRQRKVEIL